jgi:hypothetical protein
MQKEAEGGQWRPKEAKGGRGMVKKEAEGGRRRK